jgi:thymidylate synthase (FAD)
MARLINNGYMVRTTPNLWLRDSGNDELVALSHYFGVVGVERALIEFSARLCYNSTARLGTARNFVEKVLEDGHLSVAEHPSFFFKFPTFESSGGFRRPFIQKFEWLTLHERNRFIDFNQKAIFANMRSMTEAFDLSTSTANVAKVMNSTLAPILPNFFNTTEWGALEDFTPSSVYVPGTESVQLLSYNYGSTIAPDSKQGLRESKPGTNRNWSRYTFIIYCSRACSHQIARHRGASISQESQRYVDAKHNRGFVYPPDVPEEAESMLGAWYRGSLEMYESLREAGVKKEDARFILPMGMVTRMVVSFNYMELLHFLKLRVDKHAQWEIRDIARQMLSQAVLVTDEKRGKKLHELAEVSLGGSGSI